MRNWIITILVFLIITTGGVFYVINKNAVQVITYFPIDEKSSFVEASTSLDLKSTTDSDDYLVEWTSSSVSEYDSYLRQDASLLFANGALLGIRSKWEQNTNEITLREQLKYDEDAYFESISYHHGEIHNNNDSITSIQQMTFDQLLIYQDNGFKSLKTPKTNQEKRIMKDLTQQRNQRLLKHWQQLTSHFSVNVDDYHVIPLSELYTFQKENLPGFTQQQSRKIIGQLWEGLYKNYIIPATNTTNNNGNNLMPVILIDKKQTHLYVLFELYGNKEKLIQDISKNESDPE